MSFSIRLGFIIFVFFAITGHVLPSPTVIPAVVDGEEVELVMDPEEFEGEDGTEYYSPPYLWRRSGFWPSHPSDFNPMRRPVGSAGGSRSNKKSENPYHPIPRSVNTNLKAQRSTPSSADELEAIIEGLPDKRQSPGSFLLLKLGKLTKAANDKDINRHLGRRSRL